jgi:hypothetical protein
MHLAPSNGVAVRTAPYTAIALAIGLMLGSCAQWQAEQELRQSQQAQAQAAATAANDDAQCQSYGAAPGSQSYIQCRMNLDSQRAQMQQMIAGRLLGQMLNH